MGTILVKLFGGIVMIGVGIDVAKSKSMVAILTDDGEIVKAPFEIANTESGLSLLCGVIKELTESSVLCSRIYKHLSFPGCFFFTGKRYFCKCC